MDVKNIYKSMNLPQEKYIPSKIDYIRFIMTYYSVNFPYSYLFGPWWDHVVCIGKVVPTQTKIDKTTENLQSQMEPIKSVF